MFNTVSNLVRVVIEEFVEILLENGVQAVSSVEDASDILDSLNLHVNPSGRGLYHRRQNLSTANHDWRLRPTNTKQMVRGVDIKTEDIIQAVEDHWQRTGQTSPASPQTEPTYTQAELRASLEKQDQDLEQLKALDDVSLAPMVERETVK